MEQALVDTQRAFDGVAAGYDRSNSDNPLLCAMRMRARQAVTRFVPAGAHILDLGCGPGGDDEYLATQGFRVTAIDWSPAMVDIARRRVSGAGVWHRVEVRQLGIQEIDRLAPELFDAAYSSFGPLNCVPDPASAARLIADRLRPGGVLVASVIGRVCPWEIALYLTRGQWARAVVRFSRRPVPVPLDGRTVWTRYYSPREFTRIFEAAGFTRVASRTLGLFVPPPYLHKALERRQTLMSGVQRVEDAVAAWPGFRAWGDHFLIVLRKDAAR